LLRFPRPVFEGFIDTAYSVSELARSYPKQVQREPLRASTTPSPRTHSSRLPLSRGAPPDQIIDRCYRLPRSTVRHNDRSSLLPAMEELELIPRLVF